ncbi:serine hydrolase domain-containing protein [Zwartia sp.]|uniref:serine hydrolase domain-containing protein n=1 Tax=Zwartia sp. TaxID=2978004 RepID=UPI003BB155BD
MTAPQLASTSASPSSATSDSGTQFQLKTRINAVLSEVIASGRIPGVAAAVTSLEETLYEGAFGVRAQGLETQMTPDTVMWIASMTKPLVGAAAMQLVEQGKLSLDDPIAHVLPEINAIQVVTGWDALGQPMLRPPKTPITLRHLMTHTAGFTSDIWSENSARFLKLNKLPRAGSGRRDALNIPLSFDPGERWEYGINIDWIGLAISAVTGMRLGEYLQKNITGPLAMHSTGFEITPSMRARLAKVHLRNHDDQSLSLLDFEVPQHAEVDPGGGGMYSTASDYLRFTRMMLNHGRVNGQQILKPETVALMSKNAMGPLRVKMLSTINTNMSLDAEFFPGVEKTWGLTFMINEAPAPTGRSTGSLAWAGLPNAYFWIDPVRKIAGVLMMQILPFVDTSAIKLFTDFETAVYQSLQSTKA